MLLLNLDYPRVRSVVLWLILEPSSNFDFMTQLAYLILLKNLRKEILDPTQTSKTARKHENHNESKDGCHELKQKQFMTHCRQNILYLLFPVLPNPLHLKDIIIESSYTKEKKWQHCNCKFLFYGTQLIISVLKIFCC